MNIDNPTNTALDVEPYNDHAKFEKKLHTIFWDKCIHGIDKDDTEDDRCEVTAIGERPYLAGNLKTE